MESHMDYNAMVISNKNVAEKKMLLNLILKLITQRFMFRRVALLITYNPNITNYKNNNNNYNNKNNI
jgi:hypothetical protein